MKKVILCVTSLLLAFAVGGCGIICPLYRKDQIVGISEDDGDIFYFYDKVMVELMNPEFSDDYLGAANSTDGTYKSVLYGYFDKFTYEDGEVIVLMKDEYYVFDVDDYIPHEEIEFMQGITKYTKSEFEEKYPNHQDFDWTYHRESYDVDGSD